MFLYLLLLLLSHHSLVTHILFVAAQVAKEKKGFKLKASISFPQSKFETTCFQSRVSLHDCLTYYLVGEELDALDDDALVLGVQVDI